MASLPYRLELTGEIDSASALSKIGDRRGSFCLGAGSRYTLLGADPIATFSCNEGFVSITDGFGRTHTQIDDPLNAMRTFAHQFHDIPLDPYLPMSGGLVGFVGFEWGIGRHRTTHQHEFHALPDAWLGMYDTVLILDHLEGRACIVSIGLDQDYVPSLALAKERAEEMRMSVIGCRSSVTALTENRKPTTDDLTPVSPRRRYREIARSLQQHIQLGDAQKVNLAQRYVSLMPDAPWAVHNRLHQDNPTPYASFLNPGPFQLSSASSTCFLSLDGQAMVAKPVLAHHVRSALEGVPESQDFLATSPEATGLLHRLQQELTPLAEEGKIESDAPHIESDAQAYHLTCDLRLQLQTKYSLLDALGQLVPALSMTGVPKPNALQLLTQHEPFRRQAYTGAIGYWEPRGKAQFNLCVRLLTIADGLGYVHAANWLGPKTDIDETLDTTDERMIQFFSRLHKVPITTIHEQSLY